MALRRLAAPLLIAAAVGLSLWQLGSSPPPWWDEGWSMQIARNWLERGHYGRMSGGLPTNASMAHGVVLEAPITLSFRLLGVGFWQARLVIVVYFAAAAALLYLLSRRLFGTPTAVLALFLALFLSPTPSASALLMGRQVLGEVPMLAYLMAGVLALDRALRDRAAWFLPAAALLALGISAKHQLAPFLAIAFSAVAATAFYDRRPRTAALLLATVVVAIFADDVLRRWGAVVLPGYEKERFDIWSLYQVTVMVVEPAQRAQAVGRAVLFGLPSIAALLLGAGRLLHRSREERRYAAAVLLSVSAAWLTWYVVLSAGWPRYLFPALYLATPFVASMFWDAWSAAETGPRRLVLAGLAAQTLLIGVWSLARFAVTPADDSAAAMARHLNSETPPGARIETYESELTFLLERPHHSPPVRTHVEMIRNHQRGDMTTTVAYDALEADPDYLVVGPFSYTARLYEPFIESGDFRPLRSEGPYDLYERVRR